MNAFIFRKCKNNVKGRDWYDMEWYIRNVTSLNLHHFLLRAQDSGDWKKKDISEEEFMLLLNNRINTVNINQVKADIQRFIPDMQKINIWSKEYFLDLVKKLKLVRR